MSLAANALVTLEEAKAFLGNTGGGDDEKLRVVINRASEFAEEFCNRPLKEVQYTNLRLQGPCHQKLYPRATPIKISETVTVTVNTVVQTVWKSESDGDPVTFDVIVGSDMPEKLIGQQNHLWRAAGWDWGSYRNPYNVLLTYKGGFATIPEDLKLAACLVVQKMWQDAQKQLPSDVTTVSGPFGQVSVMDVVIPRQARDILHYYRRVPV